MGYDKLATEEEADLLQGSLIKRGPNKNLIALGAIGAIVLIAVIVVVAVTAGGSSSADTSVDANEEKAAATSTLKITGDFTDEGAQIAAQEAIAAELEVDVAVLESDYSYNIECDDSGITCTITITFVQEDSSPSIDIDEEAIEDAVEVVEGVSGVDADHDVDFESVDVEGVDVEGVSDVDANVVDDVVDDGDDGDDDDDSTKTIPSTSTDEVDITFSLDFDFDFAGEEMEGMSEMMNEFVACADDFYAMLYPLYTQEEVTCEQQTALVDAYMTFAACTGEDGQERLDQFCAGEMNDDESPDFLEVSCLC